MGNFKIVSINELVKNYGLVLTKEISKEYRDALLEKSNDASPHQIAIIEDDGKVWLCQKPIEYVAEIGDGCIGGGGNIFYKELKSLEDAEDFIKDYLKTCYSDNVWGIRPRYPLESH